MTVPQGILPFKIELLEEAEKVTAHAALPLLIETMRALCPPEAWRPLADALGYQDAGVVQRHTESLVALMAGGGDHASDLDVLGGDLGLEKLIGFSLSSPTQAKDFLYRFHQSEEGKPLLPCDDDVLSVVGKAQIRPEGPGLRALATWSAATVAAVQTVQPRDTATLDVDATIAGAHKKRALVAYEGTRGYQPQMAWWAEQNVWVCDEFRDGNVPAAYKVKDFLVRAFGSLPATVLRRRLRADSALYDEAALTWADDEDIEFAVSADMSEALAAKVMAIPEQEWGPYKNLKDKTPTEERQWAEVLDFIPGWKRNHKKEGEALRYIAIRVRPLQKDLFQEEHTAWRHFAVVSNMNWQGDRLLRWHREKQGTVEFAHGVLKGDLAGGVLPCGRFGANAAWWRLNVLTHNLLQLLKIQALPTELHAVRLKTLRFQLLHLPGRVVHHARSWILKLYGGFPFAAALLAARQKLLALRALLHPPPLSPV